MKKIMWIPNMLYYAPNLKKILNAKVFTVGKYKPN